MGLGGTGLVVAVSIGFAALPLVTGLVGIGAGAAYLLSPTWKLVVITDDSGLEVRDAKRSRFKLAWSDIVRVVAAPTTNTCFVDGGAPERSLLVPGDGAPAPYDLEDRATLLATILAHVTPDRVTTVESLDRAPSTQSPA